MSKKIIYMDDTFKELKQLLIDEKPKGFALYFWDELNRKEKTNILTKASYLLMADRIIGKDILTKGINLKLIQKAGIGIDNIDLKTAANLLLPVSNAPGTNAASVAELTMLFILSLYRNIIFLNDSIKQGKWLMWEIRPFSFELEGKKHGIIGFGNVGREVAIRSKAFGTKIFYYDVQRIDSNLEEELDVEYLALEELIKDVDIISCHIPLLPETKNLISYKELGTMKKNAIIINVARGGIINEQALYEALQDRMIAGAALDVWASEPVNDDNPLLKLNNVLATPHVGAGTVDTLRKVYRVCYDNIKRVDAGEKPRYVVNGVD